MRRSIVVILFLGLFVAFPAPGGAQDASPEAEPSLLADLGIADLPVTGTDAGLEMATEVPAGRYRVVFSNESALDATAEILKAPEGVTSEELVAEIEASAESEEIPAIFYEIDFNGGAVAAAGETGDVIVDLEAGSWIFNYYGTDEDGTEVNIPHTVTVTGEAPAPVEIAADVTVEMFEMDFAITGEFKAGPQIVEITNTGDQPHFLLLSRYPEPFTEAQVLNTIESFFAPPASPEAGATPEELLDFDQLEDVVDTAIFSPGRTNWFVADLEPGYYVAICFIDDPETGAPHAMLGMVEIFEIQGASPVASPAAGIVEATIDVDGRSLHLACAGDATSGPAVLFEPGGPFLDGGAAVVAAIGSDLAAALGTRFCSYDRAGTGMSDPHPMGVRTFEEAAADLRAVLASPELACPCVVVGESLGGSIALVALAEDAAGIGGLVLLDPPYPGYIDQFFSLTTDGSPETGPEFMAYNEGENEEQLDVIAGFRQVTVPAQPPAIPIVIVTHGAGYPPPCNWEPPCSDGVAVEELEAAWQSGQQELAEALGARLVVAEGTGHSIADENPGLVVGLVSEVIAAVRDPSTWSAPAATPAA